jgi:hypothetical protein
VDDSVPRIGGTCLSDARNLVVERCDQLLGSISFSGARIAGDDDKLDGDNMSEEELQHSA